MKKKIIVFSLCFISILSFVLFSNLKESSASSFEIDENYPIFEKPTYLEVTLYLDFTESGLSSDDFQSLSYSFFYFMDPDDRPFYLDSVSFFVDESCISAVYSLDLEECYFTDYILSLDTDSWIFEYGFSFNRDDGYLLNLAGHLYLNDIAEDSNGYNSIYQIFDLYAFLVSPEDENSLNYVIENDSIEFDYQSGLIVFYYDYVKGAYNKAYRELNNDSNDGSDEIIPDISIDEKPSEIRFDIDLQFDGYTFNENDIVDMRADVQYKSHPQNSIVLSGLVDDIYFDNGKLYINVFFDGQPILDLILFSGFSAFGLEFYFSIELKDGSIIEGRFSDKLIELFEYYDDDYYYMYDRTELHFYLINDIEFGPFVDYLNHNYSGVRGEDSYLFAFAHQYSNDIVYQYCYDNGFDVGYQEGVGSVDITSDNQTAIDKYIEDNNYHTDVDYQEYGESKYQEGVGSVDITSDNQTAINKYIEDNNYHTDADYQEYGESKYQEGVGSVDITSDNQTAINKYIEDNNYHTDADYQEYGSHQYQCGYNNGASTTQTSSFGYKLSKFFNNIFRFFKDLFTGKLFLGIKK